MLVHVKTPLIEVQVSGLGTQFVIETLRKAYGDVVVTDDDEAVPVESVEWLLELKQSRTQGDVLWVYRDNAGLTLDQLAALCGIAKSHLSEMENNKRPIGLKTAKKLAESLKCDYHRFLLD
jgi:DNA-binding XRE family transcriptional regulator